MQKIRRIRLGLAAIYNFIRLAMNPKNTDFAMALSDRLLDLGMFSASTEYLKSNPISAAVFDHPLNIPKFDIDHLLSFPPESLGHQLGMAVKEQDLDPNYFRRTSQNTDGAIVLRHLEQTHDIWHIITGFNTSVPGEIGLQSFMLGQMRTPQSIALVGGGLLRCLFSNVRDADEVVTSITRGWQLAKKWPPLFAVSWPEIMHMPVSEIQRALNEGRIPSP